MRKVYIFLQSLLSRRQNQHSGHSLGHEKYHTFLTFPRKANIVSDITKGVQQ